MSGTAKKAPAKKAAGASKAVAKADESSVGFDPSASSDANHKPGTVEGSGNMIGVDEVAPDLHAVGNGYPQSLASMENEAKGAIAAYEAKADECDALEASARELAQKAVDAGSKDDVLTGF